MTGINNGYPSLYSFVNTKNLPKKKPPVKVTKKNSKFLLSEIAALDLTVLDYCEKPTNDEFDFHRFAETNLLFGNVAGAVTIKNAVNVSNIEEAKKKGKDNGTGKDQGKGKGKGTEKGKGKGKGKGRGKGRGKEVVKGREFDTSSSPSEQNDEWWFDTKINNETKSSEPEPGTVLLK